MRLKTQLRLAFLTAGRGETSDADQEGTESLLAKRDTQSPASGGSHRRPLNSIEPPWYGPVCPVVWEGRSREAPPYPHEPENRSDLAPRSSEKEDRRKRETFYRNPAGNQSRPAELDQQPEASLAWRRGDPPCEA